MVTGGNIYILLSSRWRDGKREGWEEGGGTGQGAGRECSYVCFSTYAVCLQYNLFLNKNDMLKK